MLTFLRTALFLFAVGWTLGCCTGCASFPSSAKEAEAEAKYGSEQYTECIAPEPVLGPRASREDRLAAWARVDSCRARIQQKWTGITETVTPLKDGGDQ